MPNERKLSHRSRPCPLCGGEAKGETFPYRSRWGGHLFTTLACGSCRTAFVDPVPTDDQISQLYDRTAYHDCHYQLGAEEEFQSTALAKVQAFLPTGGDILDFGCGNGHFLKVAVTAGFHAEGVELDPKTRDLAAANSGCAVLSFRKVVEEGRQYDVIHLGDVLEHLPFPAETLKQLEPHLRGAGRFFIEGPLEANTSPVHLASRAYGGLKKILRSGDSLDPPLHLFRTNAHAQRAFFERRMGYSIATFIVSEDGWPYRSRGDSWARPRSPGHALKLAIADFAVIGSRVANKLGFRVGNRFATVASLAGGARN